MERFDPDQDDAFLDPAVTPGVIASGWLGFPGASEEKIAALEARLGASLPPSYRSFLRASNGFLQPGVIVPRLLATDEVDWFRVAHQATIDAWNRGMQASPGVTADDPEAFEHHLPTALQVSAPERVGTAIYLLNPEVVTAEGEWEAFYFAHWVPGVRRYPSFWELMLAVTDWGEWSRQAVAAMNARNKAWISRFDLERAPFRWDLATAELCFERATDHVVADLCLVGTASEGEGTFLWAWANETIPAAAKRGLDVVRTFGATHDLPRLVTPEWPGGRADGLEMLAIAGRVQDASGGFIDRTGELFFFFTLHRFRVRPLPGAPGRVAG